MPVRSRFRGEVDEAGHKTGPAACFEPAESERPAWREVDEAGQRQAYFWKPPALAGITDRKCLKNHAGASVCGLVANFDSVVECELLSPLLWGEG